MYFLVLQTEAQYLQELHNNHQPVIWEGFVSIGAFRIVLLKQESFFCQTVFSDFQWCSNRNGSKLCQTAGFKEPKHPRESSSSKLCVVDTPLHLTVQERCWMIQSVKFIITCLIIIPPKTVSTKSGNKNKKHQNISKRSSCLQSKYKGQTFAQCSRSVGRNMWLFIVIA